MTLHALALLESVTDSADPVTWLQAIGIGGGLATFAVLSIYLFRLIIARSKDAREENSTLDKKNGVLEEQLAKVRKEREAERQLRFAAEEEAHKERLHSLDLQRKLEQCEEDRND